MCVLVKDDVEWILRSLKFSGQGNVVDVLSSLKIPDEVWTGFERPERTFTLEDHDGGWNGRIKLYAREQMSEDFAKLFELDGDLFDLLFVRITNQKEIL